MISRVNCIDDVIKERPPKRKLALPIHRKKISKNKDKNKIKGHNQESTQAFTTFCHIHQMEEQNNENCTQNKTKRTKTEQVRFSQQRAM